MRNTGNDSLSSIDTDTYTDFMSRKTHDIRLQGDLNLFDADVQSSEQTFSTIPSSLVSRFQVPRASKPSELLLQQPAELLFGLVEVVARLVSLDVGGGFKGGS